MSLNFQTLVFIPQRPTTYGNECFLLATKEDSLFTSKIKIFGSIAYWFAIEIIFLAKSGGQLSLIAFFRYSRKQQAFQAPYFARGARCLRCLCTPF